VKTTSISPKKGGDDAELNDTEVEQQQGDKADPLKKRKGSPPKPSSQKKSKATMKKMQTILTSNDFDFLIATLNDASLEIAEKQEAKQEDLYDQIMTEL
jgi:archaellin